MAIPQQSKDRGQGWTNWYINRGRIPYVPTKRELRSLSNRRAI